MLDRFFVESPIEEGRATLAGAEAHHLLHVLRAKPGDRVSLFDGRGGEYSARVEHCRRREVVCIVGERQKINRELPFALTLAVALPKGERQRWLVEKGVELGVTRLIPLITRRTVARPNEKSLDRLRRSVVEASKQCGRNVLMEIGEPKEWPEFLRSSEDILTDRLVAHPGGEPFRGYETATGGASIAVGPEGGFVEEEIDLARSEGWQIVDLGPRILRIETAALVMITHVGKLG